jgi:alkyl sulfatase BDS1-like metallo-beta-lactamase superfamily hydrolase
MKHTLTLLLVTFLTLGGAQSADFERKSASAKTKAAHEKVIARLPFENTQDFKLATRGLLAKPDALVVKDKTGRVV